MLSISCPQCAHKMQAPDEFRGERVKCAKCGYKFALAPPRVPNLTFPALDAPLRSHVQGRQTFTPMSFDEACENSEFPGPSRSLARARAVSRTPWMWFTVIVLACVAVFTVGAWLVRSPAANTGNEGHFYARTESEIANGVPPRPVEAENISDSALLLTLCLLGGAGVVWLLWLIVFLYKREQARKLAQPTRGPIACPFCDSVVAEDAKWLGQAILCPKCHATFTAPDIRAKEKRDANRSLTMIGIVMVGLGLLLIISGQRGFAAYLAYFMLSAGISMLGGRFFFFITF
jgi:DNA-directed RNA polymerase subunit M/transcription elongation factor TFIIS